MVLLIDPFGHEVDDRNFPLQTTFGSAVKTAWAGNANANADMNVSADTDTPTMARMSGRISFTALDVSRAFAVPLKTRLAFACRVHIHARAPFRPCGFAADAL